MFAARLTATSVLLTSATSTVEILPSCGAILNRWTLSRHNGQTELIQGYDSVNDFEQNCESKGFRSAKLSPYVCRMNQSQYEFEGTRYSIGKFKLNGTAIHGLLYNNCFEVDSTSGGGQGAGVVLLHQYNGSDAGYPFTYNIQVSYKLEPNNQLTITTKITNTHHSVIPVADGWHPYFSLGGTINDLQFTMQSDTMLEFNDSLIPTGKLLPFDGYRQPALLGDQFFDNCFLLNHDKTTAACRLINPKNGLQLSIWPISNYPYLQVYTPPHRNSIAIENLSAAPDAFNNKMGLIMLQPGQTTSFATRYQAEHF